MSDSARRSDRFVLEYAGAPDGQRYDILREEVCRNFCRIDIEPSEPDHLECKVEIVQIGSLSMGRALGTSGRFLRTQRLLTDACDDLALIAATSDGIIVTQKDTSVRLQQSEMCLVDMTVPGSVSFGDGTHFTATRIPRRELLSISPGAEDMMAEPLQRHPGIRALIQRYFALSVGTAESLDVQGQQLTARHMVDLVGLLLRPSDDEARPTPQRGCAAARLQLLQEQVVENLGEAGLKITSLAESNGLSPKQVQRLFEKTGMTFAEFVLEQRLLCARRLLASEGNRQEKVATLAYTAGFGDLSYFNRSFRRRFGMTPSEWREAQPV